MPGPQIEPGQVEQGIYTWSTLDVEGNLGQWFGALSPGLSESLAWLRPLNFGSFQPLDDSLRGNYGDAYTGWEKQVTVGAFPLGDFSFVYRLIPQAGIDGRRRSRFVAHVLVGRREELGICSIAEDDPHWLEAEDCQLDRLPALAQLELKELKPLRTHGNSEAVEKTARDLLENWKGSARGLTCNLPPTADPSHLTASLLMLVPTPLWNSIDLDWRIGGEGPIAYIGIRQDGNAPTFSGRPQVEGLSDTPFHETVDREWERRGPQGKTWASFIASFSPPNGKMTPPPVVEKAEAKPASAQKEEPKSEVESRPDFDNPRELLISKIGSDLGNLAWHRGDALTEEQALRAVRTIEKTPAPPGGWLVTLEPADLHALFASIECSNAIGKAKRIFAAEEMPLDRLIGMWRETGLATVGASLLDQNPKVLQRHDSWALPKTLDEKQLRNLIAYAGNSKEKGYPRIVLLLQGGFAASREGCEAIAKAVIDAGIPPRRLFEDILPHADLDPHDLLSVVRENLPDFAKWLGLPEEYEEALRIGLRPGLWDRLKDHF